MIELSIGPYRSGKTGRLLHELVDYKRGNPLDQCLVLVPSMRYGRMLRKQLNELLQVQGSPGIFGVRIATIYQACHEILSAGGASVAVVPRDLCVRAVADALKAMNAEGQLAHLQSIHELPGTASALYRLMEEFERAALTPQVVINAVKSTASGVSRHLELANIYKRFWERLDELGVMDQKRLALSCRELLAKKQVAGLQLRFLVVDGFDRISPLQAEVIDGLSRHAVQTRIAFDYVLPAERETQDPQDDEYSWKDSSYNELYRRFQLQPVAVGVPGMNARPRQFAFTALDCFAEMQETARRCKEAILVRGIDAGQILVSARNMDDYACAAKLAFNQAGLPFFIDQATEVLALPWIKVVLQISELASQDFPRRGVIDVLRSAYVDTERFGMKPGDIERLDKNSYAANMIGGKQAWKEASHVDALNSWLKAIAPPETSTYEGYCRWFEDMLDAVMVRFSMRPEQAGRAGKEQTMQPLHDEMQAMQALRTALRTLVSEESLFGSQTIHYSQFHQRVHSLLETANFRTGEPPAGHIHICSAEHAPNRRFDEVFMVGVAEGQFPRHSGESGFVSADERARWEMFGVTLKNPREEIGYEKALFRSMVERARKSFWASYPRVDLNGDETIPSFYFTDGTINAGAIESVDFAHQALMQPTSAREAVLGWLWRQPGYTISDKMVEQREIDEYWGQMETPINGAFARHHESEIGTFNGDLSALVEAGFLTYKLPHLWSASAINNYGQCPFKFWASNMLGVEPIVEAEPGLDAMERGTLYHKILELYYSSAKAGGKALFELDEAILQKALQQAFEGVEKNPKFHPSPYWANEQKEMAFRVKRFLEFDLQRTAISSPPVKPHSFEAKFGWFDSATKALEVETEVGPISIRGSIDRIDVEQDESGKIISANVVDYKTGSTAISVDEARSGANMQIPIYAMAVEQVIMPGTRVRNGNYLSIHGAKSTGSINFEKESMADILPRTKAKIAEIVKGVAAGRFMVDPVSSKACSTCDHHTICRVADLKKVGEAADA